MCGGIACHNHTDKSNIRLLDSTNRTKDLIKTAAEQGYKGLAITDHECLSAHVEAIRIVRDLKTPNKDAPAVLPEDFKLILGNEIYLVDSLEEVRDNYISGVTKFPHFLLLAKDAIGHEQLRILSSEAWKHSFYTGTMERTPTVKSDLEKIVKEKPNHLIASSACLGSEINIHLLAIRDNENNLSLVEYHREKLHEFILWCIGIFGKENFFIELQPALSNEQIYCNEKLIQIADHYDLKRIITTDSHFLRPEDRIIHKAFLNSKDGEREVDDFYEACFLQSEDEIYDRMKYIDKEIIDDAIANTLLIGEMVEEYTIEHDPIIPRVDLPEFQIRNLFQPAYEQYEYINKIAHSDNEQDRYLLKLLEDGFQEKLLKHDLSKEEFHEILARLDIELGELWEISQKLKQSMPSYYVTTREIINIIWDDDCGGNSLVGAARGSAAGFLITYLLDITQINPLKYNLPHWRHIHKSRPDFPDIDIDTEGAKRNRIIQALKNHFGEHRVLQIATFGTEGSKSAIQTACRGLGIDSDVGLYLAGMIPFERGSNWSLNDCFYGNEEKERKSVKEFIREVEKYPNLKETALKIEGLVNKRSSHAGGIFIFNEHYVKTSALMKTPKGANVTQFNMGDAEAMGNIKFDLLTIEALDKIRVTLDQLLEYGEIEKQSSLKETYKKYIHPDVLEYDDPKLWNMVGNGEVMDLFQFSTDIGQQSVIKVKPESLLEAAVTNSLMRLMSDGDEQPVDTYVKYKNEIALWYDEMKKAGLSNNEISILEKYLKDIYGVADTQEVVMQMVMDGGISNFDIKESNYLRKSIAKKQSDVLKKVQDLFFTKGKEIGASKQLLQYVWNVQIKRQLGYSFSILHTLAYTVIALQELNLIYKFNPLYWNTACLTVNSGGIESDEDNEGFEEETKQKKKYSTNYGKVAAAIGNIRQRGVNIALPDINKARFGFSPDIENDSIIFGLKGLNGIGDDVVHSIVKHRPYTSFYDFLDRMFKTKIIKNGQMIQLIKGGCFDSYGERKDIMKLFFRYTFEPKKTLNMQNMPMLIKENLIPNEFNLEIRFFKFKKYISKFVYEIIDKPKDKILILDDISQQFYGEYFSDDSSVGFSEEGNVLISEKKFNSEYNEKMNDLKAWLSKIETVDYVNDKLFDAIWKEANKESISKWEMDALSFYYHKHELIHLNNSKYDISSFNSLPEQPEIVNEYISRGIPRQEFRLSRIAGTVLDRDKNKHQVTILTTDGVVTVKFYAGAFSHYNKQLSRPISKEKKEVVEPSWFTRGNKVLLTGFRRGNKFIPRKYKNSIYQHTVALIEEINVNGDLVLKTERSEI